MINLSQMLQATPADIRRNARYVKVLVKTASFLKKDKSKRVVELTARSSPAHGSGLPHKVTIKFHGKTTDKTELIRSPVWVSCDCEWFQYNCEVALFHKKSTDIIHSNGAMPTDRNKQLKPWICKHIIAALPTALQTKYTKASTMTKTEREEENPEQKTESTLDKLWDVVDNAYDLFMPK